MDGERFSSFACSYLTKRPRLSSQNSQQSAFNSSSMSGDSVESDDMDRDTTAHGHIANEPTDEELLCWQERQIAKCIVDNTVNRVVESYLTFFEDDDDANGDIVGDAFPDFQDPAVPFFEPINDRRLEESAILWAIDEHGLQQHINHANAEYSEPTSRSSTPSEISTPSLGPSTSSEANSQLPPGGSELVEDVKDEATTVLNGERLSDDSVNHAGESSIQIDGQTSSCVNEKTVTDSSGSTESTESSGSTTQASTSTSANAIENGINEHFDFMEAAVAVAIQKKGLAPYSIQMSPKR